MTATADVRPAVLTDLRRRREAGEGLAVLASEVGVTWQRLWGLLKGKSPASSPPATIADEPTVEAVGDGPLVERYRPRTLTALWGQEPAVRLLRRFSENPYSVAMVFEGETGTGKTSAALALARELGCDVAADEWGGVWEIASGTQTADAVRETGRSMYLKPVQGSGWKVVIVNEADRMSRPAEMVWLDLLEHLPRRTVVVFTTNDTGLLTQRFRDRCMRVPFEGSALLQRSAAYRLAERVWEAEAGSKPKRKMIESIVDAETENESLSFRRVLQGVSQALLERDES